MKRFPFLPALMGLLALMPTPRTAANPAPWGSPALQPGIAAITCVTPSWTQNGLPTDDVFALVNLRDPVGLAAPAYPAAWTTPQMLHDPAWKQSRMGEVFGVDVGEGTALNGNRSPIFVTTLGPKPVYFFPNRHWKTQNNDTGTGGEVFKIDPVTCAVTTLAVLPNHRALFQYPGSSNLGLTNYGFVGLGQPSYAERHNKVYVSNLDDGLIYTLDATTGTQLGTFDHGVTVSIPDNPAQLYTPKFREVYGLEYHPQRNRLFYATRKLIGALEWDQVFSVGLTGAGVPTGAPLLEFTRQGPLHSSGVQYNFISDIQFSDDGCRMLLVHESDQYVAHNILNPIPAAGIALTGQIVPLKQAHVSEGWTCEYTGGTWNFMGVYLSGMGIWPYRNAIAGDFGFGNVKGPGSGGGVAAEDSVVLTADGVSGGYGLQITPLGDYTRIVAGRNFDIPLGGSKTSPGDVDILHIAACMKLIAKNPVCPVSPATNWTFDLDVTNLSSTTFTSLNFTPCLPSELPPGAVTGTPVPASAAVNIPAGQTATVPLAIGGPPLGVGGMVCFNVSVPGPVGDHTCIRKVCVQLPPCPCMVATLSNPQCPLIEGQPHTVTLNVQNIGNQPAYWLSLTQCPYNEMLPGEIHLSPLPGGLQLLGPLLPSQSTGPIAVTLPGAPLSGGNFCFCVQLHAQQENQVICRKKVCITFPPCNPAPCMTLTPGTILCPQVPGGPYIVNLQITNQQPVPVYSVVFSQCSGAGGPGGGIGPVPGPPIVNLSPPGLAQNQSTNIPVSLPGILPNGQIVCWAVTLLGQDGKPVCQRKVCVYLPPCEFSCVEWALGPLGVQCPQYDGQPHTVSITVTNTSAQPYLWYSLQPCPLNAMPPGTLPVTPGPAGLMPFGPPLLPGASTVLNITLPGIPKAGGRVCFALFLYGQDEVNELCDTKICLDVPPCPPCLPCMNVTTGTVACPAVQGGPFTVPVTITNLQPVPAASALLLPCTPGLAPGEVAATPVPGSITLGPLLQNGTHSATVALSGVTSGQLACFCIRLLDAQGHKLCEKAICLTMPQCPVLCASSETVNVVCNPATGGANASITVTNLTAAAFGWYQLAPLPVGQLPPGAFTSQPLPVGLLPFSPNIPSGGTGPLNISIPPPLPSSGGTYCFLIKLYRPNEQLACELKVCLTIPPCACATIVDHTVDCVEVDGVVKRIIKIKVQNNTNGYGSPCNFEVATVLPGTGFTPNVVVLTNPIAAGSSGIVELCYTGTKPPKCIDLFLTDIARHCCCPLRLCPLWVECAPPPGDGHDCELNASVVSENGAPVAAGAWIYNGSPTSKYFTWSASPATVPGCTGTLPAGAFSPSSGTIGPIGPFSSMLVPFTVSGASLAPGQCAGYQFCFQELSPVFTTPHCCTAKVTRSRDTDVCVDWNPTGRTFPSGTGVHQIVLKNPTSSAMPLSLLLGHTGDCDFSLTGEFATADPATGMAPDQGYLPIEITLPPHSSVPVSFVSRANIFTGLPDPIGPVFDQWYLIRLCRSIVVGGPIDTAEVLSSTVRYIPRGAPVFIPEPERDIAFLENPFSETPRVILETSAGEPLSLQTSHALGHVTPGLSDPGAAWSLLWPEPTGTLQMQDGQFAGTGNPVPVQVTVPRRHPRFIRIRTKD